MARAGDARTDRLEAWSKQHGKITREADWRKVALDLFDEAAGAPVEQDHADSLVKKYREGMKGGRTIMLAQRVADEIFDWQKQDAPTRAAKAASEPPPAVAAATRVPSVLPPPPAEDLEFDPFAQPGLSFGPAIPPPQEAPRVAPTSVRPPPARISLSSRPAALGSVRPPGSRSMSEPPRAGPAPNAYLSEPPSVALTTMTSQPRQGRGRLVAVVLVLALAGLGAFFVLTSKVFAPSNTMVKGAFVSEHLGLSVNFDEPWLHDESLDDSSKKDQWTRKVSIFYHGSSANDFSAQVTLITFARDGAQAGASDAAQLGANETLGMAFDRKCNSYRHASGGQGVECGAVSTFGGRRYACFETYFNVGQKAAFTRVLMEIPPLSTGPDGAREFDEQMTRNAADAALIVSSLRALPK